MRHHRPAKPSLDGSPSQAGVRGALLATFKNVAAARSLSSHAVGSEITYTVAIVYDAVVHVAAVKADESYWRKDKLDKDARPRMNLAWVSDTDCEAMASNV